MSLDLIGYAERIERRIESDAVTKAAAAAMAKQVEQATRAVLGADLRMSGLRSGPARIKPSTKSHRAVVTASGAAFTLADKGRRRAVVARAARGSALATPWGPRQSVRGSTSRGHDIIGEVAAKAFQAGTDAAVKAVVGGPF